MEGRNIFSIKWKQRRVYQLGYLLMACHIFLFLTPNLSAQVRIDASQNFIPISEVRLSVDGVGYVQTSTASSRFNISPNREKVIIETVLLQNGTEIFATTRTPTVTNLHPNIGTNSIGDNAIGVANYDGSYTNHRSGSFATALEEVVSTPDLRSYWDMESGSLSSGAVFMDVMYPQEVPKSGYLVVSERSGNSSFNFQALDINGNTIVGAETLEVRGYEWNTKIVNQGNFSSQPQYLVVISPILFGTELPIYGFRVININGADGKIVFFRNSISVEPDLTEPAFAGDTAIVNVLTNDELMEQQAAVSNVTVSTLVPATNNYMVLRSDGFVDIDPDAPPGSYTITYNICEVGNATNCDSGSVSVEVMSLLPVTWVDFYAQEINAGNLISWKTATEKNNNKYKVWRSFNPTRTFEQIGEIFSKGNAIIPTNYSFLDTLIYHQELVYYRVDQVDYDGKTASTSVVRLKRRMSTGSIFNVFPNPHLGGNISFQLHPSWKKKRGTIDIKNNAGNTLFSEEGLLLDIAAMIPLKIEVFPAGMYFIYVQVKGASKVIKWIKD